MAVNIELSVLHIAQRQSHLDSVHCCRKKDGCVLGVSILLCMDHLQLLFGSPAVIVHSANGLGHSFYLTSSIHHALCIPLVNARV